MTGFVKKTINGRRAVCKTIKTHSRSGREYERELCWKLNPDGSRGRLISSRVAGKPKYTTAQLRKIEESRNPKARGRDEAQNAETIISPRDPRVNSWAESPSVRRRIDIKGIDTVPESRPKTTRHSRSRRRTRTPKAHKETIECKTVTVNGKKMERCVGEDGKAFYRKL